MKKNIILCVLLYAIFLGSHAQIDPTTNFPPCKCEEHATKRDLNKGFYPSTKQMKDITGWDAWEKEINCNNIFYADLQFDNSVNNDAAFFSFSVIAFQPLRITIPDFTINLMPCNTTPSELKVSVIKEHGIKNYEKTFEYEDFDRTTKSYFDVLMLIASQTDRIVLTDILTNHLDMAENIRNENDVNKFISAINRKYNIEILLPNEVSKNWEAISNLIIETLYKNNIDLRQFILNEFVVESDNTEPHTLTPDEGNNLEILFFNWLGYFSINDIDKQIYPQMKANFVTNVIGVEISTDIIQCWNRKENKKSKPQQAVILAQLKKMGMTYSNVDKFNQTEIQSICSSTYKIRGTNILFSFSNAKFESTENEDSGTDSNKFALRIDTATFQIPYKKGWIMAKGRNLMLNNSHFSGKFEFSDTIYNEKGKKIDVSFETLNKYFESLKSEGVWYDYDRYENNGKDVTIFHFEKDANSESK